MNSGARVTTDRVTFERWGRALSGLALPEELRPEDQGRGLRAEEEPGELEPGELRREPPTQVPPLVAASLALHGCADVAITVRLTMPGGDAFGCFGLSGALAASLVRSGQDVEIGLFDVGDLVDQVVRLVPVRPPAPIDAATGCVRITVLGVDAAVAGWQQILVGGESQWRRMQSGADPTRLVTVSDVHRELAADLRFALAECLAESDHHD